MECGGKANGETMFHNQPERIVALLNPGTDRTMIETGV